MKYQFRTDIETKVPTCALIENYQDLSIAIQNGDWDLVEVVADCLADTINDYTIVPEGLHIKPSGSSMVLMSEESGVIVGEDGEDIRCIAGVPVSDALCGDYSQCPDCFYKESGCRPEIGRVRLREGERGVFDTKNPMPSLMLLDELKRGALREVTDSMDKGIDYDVQTTVIFKLDFDGSGNFNVLLIPDIQNQFVNHVKEVYEKDETLGGGYVSSDLDFYFDGCLVRLEYTFQCHDENEAEAKSFSTYSVQCVQEALEEFGCKIRKIECKAEESDMMWLDRLEDAIFG